MRDCGRERERERTEKDEDSGFSMHDLACAKLRRTKRKMNFGKEEVVQVDVQGGKRKGIRQSCNFST